MHEKLYRIQVAAELTGVPEGLLRAWERRYGLVKPKRTAGGFRAYTEEDIEVLKRVKRLTEEGVAIAEASRLAQGIRRELRGAEPKPQPSAALREGPTPPGEQLSQWGEQLLQAAEQNDQTLADAVLDQAFAALHPLEVFDQVLVPTLRELGLRWHRKELTVAQEHLVSQAIRVRLFALVHSLPQGRRSHLLCACFPAEDHELGLLGFALRARYAGFRVTYLGARTPVDELVRMAKECGAKAVALSTVGDPGRRAFRQVLSQVREALPSTVRLWVGGAGAESYGELCEELGALHLKTPRDWDEALA